MTTRRIVLFIAILAILLFIWQLPALLRALPSRYVAAYLPEPVQALAARDHVDILPTAAAPVNARELIDDSTTSPEETQMNVDAASSSQNETDDLRGSSDVLAVTREDSEIDDGSAAGANQQATKTQHSTSTPEAADQPTPMNTPIPTPVPLPTAARLQDIRHHFQTWNNCGPATLAMGLSYFDLFQSQEQTASLLKPDPEDRNVTPQELVDYVNHNTELSAIYRVNGDLSTVLRFVSEGIPVIVELGLDPPGEYRWMDWYGHYLLLVAYDLKEEKVWVYDSWFGTSDVPGENADPEGRQIDFSDLDRYWQQFNRSYAALYEPSQQSLIEEIIGENINDASMWQSSLERTKAELGDNPNDAYLWFNLGTIYNALGSYERAAGAFDQARAQGLPWRMLWYQFGPFEAYYQVGRYDDVILLADVTLENRPYFEESYYYKGLALQALGDLSEASSNFEKASRFNPQFEAAQLALDALES